MRKTLKAPNQAPRAVSWLFFVIVDRCKPLKCLQIICSPPNPPLLMVVIKECLKPREYCDLDAVRLYTFHPFPLSF